MAIDSSIIDSLAHGVERVGIPAGLIFAGLWLFRELVKSVGPSVARFLASLTEKLDSHSVEHTRIDGKLDTHHEAHKAALEKVAADLRISVESARGDVIRAVDASADRIVEHVRAPRGKGIKVPPAPAPREAEKTPASVIRFTLTGNEDTLEPPSNP